MKCPNDNNEMHQVQITANYGLPLFVNQCDICGGIWFDATELQRVSARAATTLHSIWNVPRASVKLTEPRMCPRCPEQVLEAKWFSDLKQVEIDQCPKCSGIWLDAGEFTRIYDEFKGAKVTSPLWAAAMEVITAFKENKKKTT